MNPSSRGCPMAATPVRAGACPVRPACRTDSAALMPREGAERAAMLALRFVAAASDTGDAACWDAAFDRAEAEFGPRDGALLVARAAALLRALRREDVEIQFLPPPCRCLSPGEADLLGALRIRLDGQRLPAETMSGAMRAALADLVAPIRPHRPSEVLSPRASVAARAAARFTV